MVLRFFRKKKKKKAKAKRAVKKRTVRRPKTKKRKLKARKTARRVSKKRKSVKRTVRKATRKVRPVSRVRPQQPMAGPEQPTAVPPPPAAGQLIGKVTHYFPHVQAGVISLTDGNLALGDTIHIKGHTTDLKQQVSSMQINNAPINEAQKGQEIGILLKSRVRHNDLVYKL